MSKAGRSKKSSNDDVLRAEDIVPPYGKETPREQSPQEKQAGKRKSASSGKKAKQSSKSKNSPAVNRKSTPAKDAPAKAANAERQESEIPRFDLADKIMAKQRNATAATRKGPGRKGEAPCEGEQGESVRRTIEQPRMVQSEGEQIIAEIVARDIEELCRGQG